MSCCVQGCLNLGGTPLLQQQSLQAVIALTCEHNKPKLGALAANFKSVASKSVHTDAASQQVLSRADVPAYMPRMDLISCCLGPFAHPMVDALRILASNMIESAVAQGAEALHENWVRSLLDCLHYHA